MSEQPRALETFEALAGRIDLPLLAPTVREDAVFEACQRAAEYGLASVVVRGTDVDLARRTLAGSSVKLGASSSQPHGSAATAVKLYEVRDLLRRGVKEVEMSINVAKLASRQFHYVENELIQAAQACHEAGAILKAVLETPFLTEEQKLVAAKICKRSEVDVAVLGSEFSASFTRADIELMVRKCTPLVKVSAAPVHTLDAALDAHEHGCERIGAPRAFALLDSWKARLATRVSEAV